MTGRRQLIRGAACWAVALSLGIALSTTESEAQPLRRVSSHGPASREAGDGVGVLCVIVGGAPRPRLPLVVASRQEALEPATAELDLPQTAGVMIGVVATAQDRCAASFRRLVSDSAIVPSPIRSRTCSRASRPLKRTDELR